MKGMPRRGEKGKVMGYTINWLYGHTMECEYTGWSTEKVEDESGVGHKGDGK